MFKNVLSCSGKSTKTKKDKTKSAELTSSLDYYKVQTKVHITTDGPRYSHVNLTSFLEKDNK